MRRSIKYSEVLFCEEDYNIEVNFKVDITENSQTFLLSWEPFCFAGNDLPTLSFRPSSSNLRDFLKSIEIKERPQKIYYFTRCANYYEGRIYIDSDGRIIIKAGETDKHKFYRQHSSTFLFGCGGVTIASYSYE